MLTRIACCILLFGALAAAPAARRTTMKSSQSCCAAAASLPAAPLGTVSVTGGAVNVVLNGNTAYACGPNAIGVIDISNLPPHGCWPRSRRATWAAAPSRGVTRWAKV